MCFYLAGIFPSEDQINILQQFFIPTWLPRLIVPMQKAEIPKLVWLVWTDADVGCQSVSGIFLSPRFETCHLFSHPS